MYTILCTQHTLGSVTMTVKNDQVRKECERLRKTFSNPLVNTYIRIEVINNDTGEIREYWNNKQNELLF